MASHPYVACLGTQARAVALGAQRTAPVACQHDAVLYLVLSLLEHLEEGIDADEAPFAFFGCQCPVCRYTGFGGAVPKPVFLALGEFVVGLMDGKPSFCVERDEPVLPLAHLVTAPAHHGSLVEAQGGVGDDELFVDAHDASETLTLGAGPDGGVEGKEVVGGFAECHAVGLETGGEGVLLSVAEPVEHHLAAALVEGCLGTIDKA